MKAVLAIVMVLIVYSVPGYSQERMPKMSLQEIKAQIQEIKAPEEKLRKYVEMGNRFLRNDPDSLFKIANEIYTLQAIEEQEKIAFSSLLKANAWRLLDADSAIYYAEKATSILKEIEEHSSYFMMENLRAIQYERKNSYLKAESLFLDAISYHKEVKEQTEYPIQFFYGNLGNLYVKIGAHDLAIEMFEKFIEYEDKPASRCNILSKLGSSFLKLGEQQKAISVLSPCLEFENLPPPIKTIVRTNLSEMYTLNGDSVQGLALLEEGVSISNQYKIPNLANAHTVRLGSFYLQMGLIDKADSVAVFIRNPVVPYSRPNEDIVKHEFLASLELAKGRYTHSLYEAEKTIELAKKYKLEPVLREIYSIKSDALAGLGRLDEALIYERKQKSHNQEKFELEKKKGLAMMSVRYQLQNKENQLEYANLTIENIRYRNFAIIISMILIAGFLVYRYRVYYLLKEERTRNQIARDLHDDLSGTLSSISFFSEAARRVQSDPKESLRFLKVISKSAVEAKEKINDIIWAIDPAKDDWSVFLKKCKRFAADLLDSNDMAYTFDMDDSFSFPVELEVRQNLWLIFKECITNLSKYSNANRVEIILKEDSNKVLMRISDDGVGFDPEKLQKGNGIKNIHYRTDQINGIATLDSARGKGTTWTFEFKIK